MKNKRFETWRGDSIYRVSENWGFQILTLEMTYKQIIYHSKGIDESYPKMYFLLNLSYYVKSFGYFCQNFGIFYNAHSPNMVMSHGPRSKFRNFLFFPNSTFNIKKSHKISNGKAPYFKSCQQKTHPPPSAFRVKILLTWNCRHITP